MPPLFPLPIARGKPPFRSERSERRNPHRSTVNGQFQMQMNFLPLKHALIYSALRFQHLKITPKTAIFHGILVVILTIMFAVFRKTYAFFGKACDERQPRCCLRVWGKKGRSTSPRPLFIIQHSALPYSLISHAADGILLCHLGPRILDTNRIFTYFSNIAERVIGGILCCCPKTCKRPSTSEIVAV